VSTYAAPIASAQRAVAAAQATLRALLLLAAVERDGSSDCAYCRVPTISKPAPNEKHREITLDHVIPLSCNGSDTLENVCVACRSCNSRRGVRPQREYAVVR
jgi:5-methylcytosine-specific restriction endonuclease McrA